MATNAQKTPFARSLERFSHHRALDAYNLTGKGLPCSVVSVSGSLVTVNFEVNAAPFTLPNIQVPMFGPEYIRFPMQVGDKGVVVPFDALLGAISGLGGTVANLNVPPSNLGALVFSAISSINWFATDDPNSLVMYGPGGFILRDTGAACKIIGTPTTLTLEVGGSSIVLSSSGIALTGTLTINGKPFLSHDHTGVQTGGGTSGPVGP